MVQSMIYYEFIVYLSYFFFWISINKIKYDKIITRMAIWG